MSHQPHSHGHDSRFEDWLPAYALSTLEGEELARLEAHLAAGCRRCASLLEGWDRDLEALAEQAPEVEPSAHTRTRVLARVRMEAGDGGASATTDRPTARVSQAPRPSRRLGRWALAASLAAVAFSLGLLWSQVRTSGTVERLSARTAEVERLQEQLQRLEAELGRSRLELAGLRGHVERLALSVQTLGGGGRSYALAGLEGAPDAGGVSFVDPRSGRAVFTAFGLPEAPAGKTYQLWWIAGGQPVSAGVFDVGDDGTASLEVTGRPPAEPDLWAVTVEPAGGSPQPTGEMVLKS